MEYLLLLVSLATILIAAEIFVNGVEWLGKLLKLSEGAVGSVLAAVGTALPETLIPIIAIVFGTGDAAHSIGIGAILGAPLMLSTLAMFITGAGVLLFARRRRTGHRVHAHYETMSRDLLFFVCVFGLAVLCGLIPMAYKWLHYVIAGILVMAYMIYVKKLVSQQREEAEEEKLPKCYAAFGRPAVMEKRGALVRVLLQIAVALAGIIFGAELFVDEVTDISHHFDIDPFILSLIIAPIATELPEKFNSIIWVSRGKDTLALGNITGAMVFQSSVIPALGILLTDWQLSDGGTVYVALLSIASALMLWMELRVKKHITAPILLLAGIFYIGFICMVAAGIIR